jgi:hypothetical protein
VTCARYIGTRPIRGGPDRRENVSPSPSRGNLDEAAIIMVASVATSVVSVKILVPVSILLKPTFFGFKWV